MITLTKKICFPCIKVALLCILAFLLVLQLIVISLHYTVGAIQVPNWAIEKINERLADENLSLQLDYARIDLGGHLLVKNLQVFDTANQSPILTADYALFRLSRIALLFRNISPVLARLHNVNLYEVSNEAYTGQKKIIIEKMQFSAVQEEDHWKILGAIAHWNQLQLYGEGAISQAFAPDQGRAKIPWRIQWQQAQESLNHWKQKILWEPQTTLRVNFSIFPDEAYLHDLFFYSPTLYWEEKNFLEEIHLYASAQRIDDTVGIAVEEGFAETISYDDYRLDKLSLRGNFTERLMRASFFAEQVETPQAPNFLAQGDANFNLANRTIQSALLVQLKDLQAKAHLRYDLTKQQGDLAMSSAAHPKKIFEMLPSTQIPPEVQDFAQELTSDGDWFWRATSFIKAKEFSTARLSVTTRNSRFGEIAPQYAVANMSWQNEQITLEDIRIHADTNRVHSNITIDLDQQTGFVQLDGQLAPHLIDPYMPRWWEVVWRDFSLSPEGVQGDFGIHFSLEKENDYMVFGRASGKNASFRGMAIDEGSCKVYVIPGLADIFDLQLARGDGRATGALQWVYERGVQEPFANHFSINSTFLPEAWATVINPEVNAVIGSFRTEHRPTVVVDGIWYGSHTPRYNDSEVTIRAQTDQAISFEKMDFSRLSFLAQITKDQVRVSEIEAGLCEGQANGSFTYLFDREENFQISGTLQDADSRKLKELLGDDGTQQTGGIISLKLNAEGVYGDWSSFIGGLTFQLRDANIAKLPLLGFLSQLSTIGNVKITTAEGYFAINQNTMTTENLVLSGPTTKITGNGDYGIDKKSLKMRLKVLPLKQIPFFMPLSHVLEIDLYNTMDEPKWRFVNNPINLFRPLTEEPSPSSTKTQTEEFITE